MSEPKVNPLRYVARVTLEAKTPFAVRSGGQGFLADSRFVTDGNGLPTIPGSSLAGMLRQALRSLLGEDAVKELFGWCPTTKQVDDEVIGQGSRLVFSWAVMHDANNHPVERLLTAEEILADEVLRLARDGVWRDHVRIGTRGAAEDEGKFDEILVGAGHRFTFEIGLTGGVEHQTVWETLLGVLAGPGVRLGAGSRRGLGHMELVRLYQGAFDLSQKAGFQGYAALSPDLGCCDGLTTYTPPTLYTPPMVAVTLKGFSPRDQWSFGGGTSMDRVDLNPVAEWRVFWDDAQRGTVRKCHYLPATGIKGPLAHRVAWHYNRLTGNWADNPTDASSNEAVNALFGTIKDAESEGRRGVLVFDDLHIEQAPAAQVNMHVSLDRFTGGARRGFLFNERVLVGGFASDYTISVQAPDAEANQEKVRQALQLALEDIRKGRITFGAGAGRGNGVFTCTAVEWDDRGEWVRSGSLSQQSKEQRA